MFDALEWLASVTAAVRSIEADAALISAARGRLDSLGSCVREVIVRSSPPNPMDGLIDVMDLERERSERIAHAKAEVAEARLVFEGMRRIGAMESGAADAMEMVHVACLSKSAAASKMGISRATMLRRYLYGVDWLDAHGLAHAKAGVGRAT